MEFKFENVLWDNQGDQDYHVTGSIEHPSDVSIEYESEHYDAENETYVITFKVVDQEGNPAGHWPIDLNVSVPEAAKKGDTRLKGKNGRVIQQDSVILE